MVPRSALGITRLNVYTGLAGLYIIRDEVEGDLNLPNGPYEIPLLIRISPSTPTAPYSPDPGAGRSGRAAGLDPRVLWNTVLVNGKVWPFLEVEPRKYRFRILNASNARFYHLTLNEAHDRGPAWEGLDPPSIRLARTAVSSAPVRLTRSHHGPGGALRYRH